MSITTPNMNLTQPTQGIDTGVTWEQSMNSNTGILDSHTHAAGSGVQIQPSGINISSDLTFSGNNAVGLRSSRYIPQVSPLALGTDLGCTYVAGADLWYNDTAGNQIQITAGGTVNATSSGIASGTATASFSSDVLVVNQNTNTPGNIQAGSYLMGLNTAGSNFLTLSPPSALSSGGYTLTLPTVPGALSFLSIDNSGNIAPNAAVSQGLTGSNLANNTVTRTQIVALGRGVGSGSGNYSNATGTPTTVDAATLTCSGSGDVQIMLVANSAGPAEIVLEATGGATVRGNLYVYKDSSLFNTIELQTQAPIPSPSGITIYELPPVGLIGYDITPSAGSHTYGVLASIAVGAIIYVTNCTVIVKELL
jgi:hypothetical protein